MRLLVVLALLFVALPARAEVVRVGSKRFTESYVLAEILTQLARKEGLEARHEQGLGATAVTFRALEGGSIDAYPEYTGTLAEAVLHVKEGDIATALAARGLVMSPPIGFENTYALAVKRSAGLRKTSELATRPGLRYALSHEFVGRDDGWPGLAKRYDLHPASLAALDHALAYQAIEDGRADVVDVYTTDAKIPRLDLVVLEDDLHYFPSYQAVVVYRRDVPPAFTRAVAKLHLDAATMQRLNARAELDGVPSAEVAREWLTGDRRAAPRRGLGSSLLRSIADHGPRHLLLVLVALAISALLGVPLGILAHERPRAGAFVLGVTGVVQTIPSLALFCFFLPLLGIGVVPALAALALYGLLPIVRNTHAGLASIPAPLRDAAHALGLTRRERLRHVELPLASRTIVAGLKTSAVVAVGSATIAAFIGAGGFGEPISTGLSLNDIPTILAGAIPAAALALLVQGAFGLVERLVVPRGLRLRAGP